MEEPLHVLLSSLAVGLSIFYFRKELLTILHLVLDSIVITLIVLLLIIFGPLIILLDKIIKIEPITEWKYSENAEFYKDYE